MSGRKPGPVMPADIAATDPVLDVYVPTSGSSYDDAVLLTGTAAEYGLSQRHMSPAPQGGYWISEALADIIYDGVEPEDDESTETPDAASAESGSATQKG